MTDRCPLVLVTGFPNSGTSFVAELVVSLGFFPGDQGCLRPADSHNPHGYWEHDVLHALVRTVRQVNGFHAHVLDSYPEDVPDFSNHPCAETVSDYTSARGIQVYKDNSLPVSHSLFPSDARVVVAIRDKRAVYESGNYEASDDLSFPDFCKAYEAYGVLVSRMYAVRDCLYVGYESFGDDFDRQVDKIASFLNVRRYDPDKCRSTYRPRRTAS